MSIYDFDAEAYWADKETKKWVVFIQNRARQKKDKVTDIKIVGARTKTGAVKTARANSFMRGRVVCSARLATPADLGCVEVKV